MQDHNPEQIERDYQKFVEELNGTAARRKTARLLEEEAQERQEELRRHSEETGAPMPRNFEDEWVSWSSNNS